MSLDTKAVLVQLNISVWNANRLDKAISKETAYAKGAVNNSVRVNKSLLPACKTLDNIKKKAATIRSDFYGQTLPWGMKGTQILPTANYMEFMDKYRKHKAEFEALVAQFLPDYEDLVQAARKSLGAAWKSDDYPHPKNIAYKFSISLSVMPVPTQDFRVQVSAAVREQIREDIKQRVEQASETAMQDLWQRLYDKVKHFADTMSDPDAKFRAATVTHLTDLCALLPRMNVMDDPNLETMRKEVEQKLANIAPTELRSNMLVRKSKANDAKEIMDKMSTFMGPQQ